MSPPLHVRRSCGVAGCPNTPPRGTRSRHDTPHTPPAPLKGDNSYPRFGQWTRPFSWQQQLEWAPASRKKRPSGRRAGESRVQRGSSPSCVLCEPLSHPLPRQVRNPSRAEAGGETGHFAGLHRASSRVSHYRNRAVLHLARGLGVRGVPWCSRGSGTRGQGAQQDDLLHRTEAREPRRDPTQQLCPLRRQPP